MQKLAWTRNIWRVGLPKRNLEQRKLLDIEQRVLGPEDHDTVGVKGDLASTLSEEGHLAESGEIATGSPRTKTTGAGAGSLLYACFNE